MTTTPFKPFIGFILTDSCDVKPVEVRPHPIMSNYGLLPTGKRILLSKVYATPEKAYEAGTKKCRTMKAYIDAAQAKLDKRIQNLQVVKASIENAGRNA